MSDASRIIVIHWELILAPAKARAQIGVRITRNT